MLAYIKGKLVSRSSDSIIVENNGIGFNVFVPMSVLDALPHVGENITIYTYFLVKEDAMNLYGFLRQDDLNVFKLLITVSGIGPKGALAVLSTLTPDDLRFAVLAGDAKAISKAPGVGNKTAQRLIIELKDKLKIEDVISDIPSQTTAVSSNPGIKSEAIEALVALGYTQSDAYRAVSSVTQEADTVEELLKLSLKQLL